MWTVSKDWEARTGILNDVFHIESLSTYNTLRTRFADEKLFLSVVNALAELEVFTLPHLIRAESERSPSKVLAVRADSSDSARTLLGLFLAQ
jgi:hypothetical protein